MKTNNSKNYKRISKLFNQYKIELISNLNSIIISIKSNSLFYQSNFNFQNLKQLFIGKNRMEDIIEFICILIEHNMIKIEENEIYLKLILSSTLLNSPNIELILNKVLSNLNLIKTINVQKDYINSISIFPSGNIISVSEDKSIKIFDIHYNILQNIKNAHDESIIYVDVKDENNFITCSYDKSIKTWIKFNNEFKINQCIYNAHKEQINKVLYHSNSNIISCSRDKIIKIWEELNKNYQLITSLSHSNCVYSILLLEDINILISSGFDGTKLWNLNNFELIIFFQKVKCLWWNALNRIDNDRIIIGDKSLVIISISKKSIIKEIKISFNCIGITIIKEKRIFLVGGSNEDIKIYNNNNYQCIQTIKNAHKDYINGFIELKNGLIASFSDDGLINIWSL